MAIFEADRGVAATAVEQPAAQLLLRPEHVGAYDAVLFYDMSGIELSGRRGEGAGAFVAPPDDYRHSVEALLESGTGIVLLNHALVSWPAWPLWRELSGSSFLLRGGELSGQQQPASGFRGGAGELERNASMRLRSDAPGHPVLAGIEEGFEVRDELYLKTAGIESQVLPLLRSDYAFEQENFSVSPLASAEERAAWSHPTGSDLVVWARAARRSPVVASELGDGPEAYSNPGFRRLVGNAVRWVASREARAWATETSGLASRR